MDKAQALSRIQAHETELRQLGIASLSMFGSTARGTARPDSDVDLAATFDEDSKVGAFAFAIIAKRLSEYLGASVDLVGEPARKVTMQSEIDRDRLVVF